MRHTIRTRVKSQTIPTAKNQVEKTGRTWYIVGDTNIVVDSTGRRGYEQYQALAFHPDGSIKIIEAKPKKGEKK